MFFPGKFLCSALAASIIASLALTDANAAVRAAADTEKAASTTPGPEAFRVLESSQGDGPEITPYLLYQTSMAWRQDAVRRARWSQIRSEADLQALRAELRKSVLAMIGGLPSEKTDLHATITGTVSGDGFHVEKLIYQSIPGLYVTALVYVPDDGVKVHPAVLVAAGHSPKGKIYYQELCQRLVKRGYLVLSWDPPGQGERSQFWNAKTKKSRYNMICAEHAVMGNLAYLAGTNLARWEVWDGMRAVDYLLSRPDADAARISLTGTSGGGFQTALLGALDARIQVIIPSCYITALPMRMGNRIFVDPDSDPEQDLFGLVSKHVDHPGLLLMMYPRPVMVAGATLDYFPIQGTEKSYSEVRTLYERFGHADRIGLAESYNRHQYSPQNQEAALNFLDRFNRMPVRRGLPAVHDFDDKDLQVTTTGQLLVEYAGARALPYYIAQYAAAHKQEKAETVAAMYRSQEDPHISSWKTAPYAGSAPDGELRWELTGSSEAGGVRIERYLLHHSTYLQMPMLRMYNQGNHAKGALLWLRLDAKASEQDWPEIARLAGEGYEVYSFDFRGQGETRMRYRAQSEDDPALAQGSAEQAYSDPLASVLAGYVYNSLLTGRPYFLQLLDDIKIADSFIRGRDKGAQTGVTLAASGDASFLTAYYKELEPTVNILSAHQPSLKAWSALVQESEEDWPIAFLLPSGALVP